MRRLFTGLVFIACLAFSQIAAAWDIQGGAPWARRVGPGVHLIIGGNQCTDEYCDDVWDTSFGGSIAATMGFNYRIIPNLVLFGEIHTGYINTDMNDAEDDRGLLFELTGGAEFHLPVTGWFAPYAGLGIGFAYLRLRHEGISGVPEALDFDLQVKGRGINFEFRIGADFYPFSAVPTLALGPIFRLGMVAWPTVCVEVDGEEECDNPDDLDIDQDDLPFLIHLGIAAKYGF